MILNKSFILEVLPAAQIIGSIPEVLNFCVDSRCIDKGDIFVAVSGARVDGHDYIEQALESGAIGLVIENSRKDAIERRFLLQYPDLLVISFDNVQESIIKLAAAWRLQFSYPVIAVTGSVGKTTTKEMIKSMLTFAGKKVLASFGNQNTLIGCSLNILKMNNQYDAAVFELGISQQGVMKQLTELAKPTIALITAIGHAHVQGLGGLSMIAQEKKQIFLGLNAQGIAIVNGDSIYLQDDYPHTTLKFGMHAGNDLQAFNVRHCSDNIFFDMQYQNQRYQVVMPGLNVVRVSNAIAAASVLFSLGISGKVIVDALRQPVVVQGRFAVHKLEQGTIIIDDAYNANPDSMKASLNAFMQISSSLKKILVIGDMLELDDQAIAWHQDIAQEIAKMDVDQVILVGNYCRYMIDILAPVVQNLHFTDLEQAMPMIAKIVNNHDSILLLKGSHSIGLSNIVSSFI